MAVNGRAKGSSFERQVAKMFVEAFAHKGITADDCYRTPGSGGHLRLAKKDPGDLLLSGRFQKLLTIPLAVECKFHRSVELMRLMALTGHKGPVEHWWEQATKAAGTKKVPLLIFKQNRGEILAMYRIGDIPEQLAYMRPFLRTCVGRDQVRVVRLVRLLGVWNGEAKWLKG